jgi:hypothetical protein
LSNHTQTTTLQARHVLAGLSFNRLAHMARPERKETARLLAAKGMSTREIAELTGWSFSTIASDLRVQKRTESVQNRTTDRARNDERAADVAAAAAQDGVTPELAQHFRGHEGWLHRSHVHVDLTPAEPCRAIKEDRQITRHNFARGRP